MSKYIIIKTQLSSYKCHAYRIKAGRVYFNARAVALANVVKITGKNDEILYENVNTVVVVPPRVVMHHYSTLKGADKCKATKPSKKIKPKKSSSLPDVIEI